ncbi:MAG TPA: threonine synthase, partial [Anaerolineales bacterium]|nr:threonine synthase [Anaerolineales bacterium]
MKKVTGYQCSVCSTKYTLEEVTYTCPKDGGVLDVVLDFEKIKINFSPADITNSTDYSMWRYLPILPVSDPGHYYTPLRS